MPSWKSELYSTGSLQRHHQHQHQRQQSVQPTPRQGWQPGTTSPTPVLCLNNRTYSSPLIPLRIPVSQPAQHRGGVEQQQLVADLLAAAQPPHHLLALDHHLLPLEELLLTAGEEEERRDQLAQRSPKESGDRGSWRGGAGGVIIMMMIIIIIMIMVNFIRWGGATCSRQFCLQVSTNPFFKSGTYIQAKEMELVNLYLGNSF